MKLALSLAAGEVREVSIAHDRQGVIHQERAPGASRRVAIGAPLAPESAGGAGLIFRER